MHLETTTILLLTVPNRYASWLLFGNASHKELVHAEPSAARAELFHFPPSSLVGISRQTLNDYGVVDWEMWLVQTVRPGEHAHLLPGVKPGARLLLYLHGKKKAAVLQNYLKRLEELELDPALTFDLHRRAAPYLQSGVVPADLINSYSVEGRAG